MQDENTKLLVAFAVSGTAETVGIGLDFPGPLMAVMTPLPMLLLGLWFYRFTSPKSQSWMRTAMLGSVAFCILGDAVLPWGNLPEAYHSTWGFVMRACFLASYSFIASAFFAKTPLSSGYLRHAPRSIIFVLAHYGLLAIIWEQVLPTERFAVVLFSIFVMTAFFAIVNTRKTVPEKHWRWAFAGIYCLILSEAYVGYAGDPYNMPSNGLYLLGHFSLMVGAARMVRWER